MEERTKSDGEERPFPERTAMSPGKEPSVWQGHEARVYITSHVRFSDFESAGSDRNKSEHCAAIIAS